MNSIKGDMSTFRLHFTWENHRNRRINRKIILYMGVNVSARCNIQ